jgi:hypothetical protein
MDANPILSNPVAAAEFWRMCCEKGIAAFEAPMPFQEHKQAWFVQKNSTLVDRKSWSSTHTFDELNQALEAIVNYFKSGVEPRVEKTEE